MRVGATVLGGGSIPLWVAYKAGLFGKYNVPVEEVVYIPSGETAVREIISGKIKLASAGSYAAVKAALTGKGGN